MIVEWYALKCMSLGAFFTWLLIRKWTRFNKPRTYYVESLIVAQPVRNILKENLMATKNAKPAVKSKGAVKKPAKKPVKK